MCGAYKTILRVCRFSKFCLKGFYVRRKYSQRLRIKVLEFKHRLLNVIYNKMLIMPLILFLTYFTYKTSINTAQKSKNYENEDNLAKEKM